MNFWDVDMVKDCKRRFVVFAVFVANILSTSTAMFADINLENPIIDQYAVARQAEHFQFSEDGDLVGGPIRAMSEPIDYSSLIKEIYLRRSFEQSVLRCFEGILYCDDGGAFRWPSKSQSLKVFEERGTMAREDFDALSETLRIGLAATGISVSAEANVNNANLVLEIGSLPYLEREMKDQSDRYGLNALAEIGAIVSDMSIAEFLKYLALPEKPFCYTSTKDRRSKGQVRIYLNKPGLESCLPNALMIFVGLNATGFDLPSVTDRRLGYKASTLGDILFARLLYHEEFPVDGSKEEIEQFWIKNAGKVREDLLLELDLKN